MSKYRVSNWCSFEIITNDTYRIYNHVDQDTDELDAEDVRRIGLLDNTSNPTQVLVNDGMSQDEAEDFVDYLIIMDILKPGRFFATGMLSKGMTLVTLKNTEKFKPLAIGIVAFISIGFIPSLYALGSFLKAFFYHEMFLYSRFNMLGIVVGMFIGAILHEIAHTATCIAFDGGAMEMGISFDVLPGAYSMIDTSCIKSKWGKVATYLAGIQANVILAAVFSLLSLSSNYLSGMYAFAALINVELAIVNLLCIEGLDGARVVKILMNYEENVDPTSELPSWIKSFFRVSVIYYAVLLVFNVALIFGW